MWKLIIKNLWTRRRRNGWLLAELILVSMVTWVIIDPVVVLMHDRSIPNNYDVDRLCLISLATLAPEAVGYEVEDSSAVVDNYLRLVQRVKGYPDIEQAAPVFGFCYPNSPGTSNNKFFVEGDTSKAQLVMMMDFLPHTNFFETYGIQGVRGMTAAQLSDYNYTKNDIVLTDNGVNALFGTKDFRGKRCYSMGRGDTTYMPVVGVIENIKAYSYWRPITIAYRPTLSMDVEDIPEGARVLIRLRQGVSMEHFLHNFRPWMVKEMRAGNLFARSVKSYEDIITDGEFSEGVTGRFRMNTALAVFFLINLCLGVIGTFWLQTRVRREEVGVMLSFGGTPRTIVRLLMGEGVVLTTFATLVGCLLFLQYALKEGLYAGQAWEAAVEGGYWVSTFTSHFLIISLIVYAILLVVVLIGIYIPARKISRISPTEALRDQ